MNIDDVFITSNVLTDQKSIDLVYTYVNPYDVKWKEKYKSVTGKTITNDVRYDFGSEQLLFSLKTAEKYMSWINKIYIVHDNQQFDIESILLKDKVVWIDHSTIIPSQFLPTFNSMVIEAFLWNIPDISEYFLYLNDDMFFGNYVFYNDLFDQRSGKPIQFYSKCHYYDHSWMHNIKQTNTMFKKLYPKHDDICPQHAPYFIQRSILEKTYTIFKSTIWNMLCKDKIRTYNLYAHNLIFIYAMYASYHQYVLNKKISFSPISSLKSESLSRFEDKTFRKKFYCFFSPVKTLEQKKLYNKLQQMLLS